VKQNLQIALRITIATTVLLGLIYPLAVTGLAQLLFPHRTNGSLIVSNNQIVGSELIGQGFSSSRYFHSRPSAAGSGYDANQSSGSNLAPTNHLLFDRINADATRLHHENPGVPIPIDLLTASGSGLDPDITPAAAQFQIPRIAVARNISESDLRALVDRHTELRQFFILGEPRVNVLELNLALDAAHP
jgi:potassium-transporting ATPase KdpC subunit